jgi:hypothetical protein
VNYEVQCPCGRAIVVGAAQAGSQVACECGQAVQVPSLLKLKASAVDQPTTAEIKARELRAAVSVNLQDGHCPYCGQSMQAGAVLGDRYQLKWLPNDESLFMGVWAVTGEPIGEKGMLQRPKVRGLRCDQCRRIVLEY